MKDANRITYPPKRVELSDDEQIGYRKFNTRGTGQIIEMSSDSCDRRQICIASYMCIRSIIITQRKYSQYFTCYELKRERTDRLHDPFRNRNV